MAIPEETMASIIRELERQLAFWIYTGTPMPVALQCKDCGLFGADVRSRYNQDPERCDACHKKALKEKCSSS